MSDQRLTMSVPEAGAKYFNLKPARAYQAAARGEIPVIKIGRLLRVPIAALNSKFGIEPDAPTDNAPSGALPPSLAKQLLGILDMEKMDAAEVTAVWTLLKYLRNKSK